MVDHLATTTWRYREALGRRLSEVTELFDTKSDAAAAGGVTVEQFNKWLKGAVKVPADALYSIASLADVDFSWLVTGDGAADEQQKARLPKIAASRPPRDSSAHRVFLDEDGNQVRPPSRAQKRAEAERTIQELESIAFNLRFVELPFYQDVAASAGPGAVAAQEQPDSVIAFASGFMRDLGAAADRCSVIRARGDSMSPTIPDAALLIVDHGQAEVTNGYIMVINVGEDLLVKRVRRRLDGLIDLLSDNPAYPTETIGADRIPQLRIVGRVVYFCRTP